MFAATCTGSEGLASTCVEFSGPTQRGGNTVFGGGAALRHGKSCIFKRVCSNVAEKIVRVFNVCFPGDGAEVMSHCHWDNKTVHAHPGNFCQGVLKKEH